MEHHQRAVHVFSSELARNARDQSMTKSGLDHRRKYPFKFFTQFLKANVPMPDDADVLDVPLYKLLDTCHEWIRNATGDIDGFSLFRYSVHSARKEYGIYKLRVGKMRFEWFDTLRKVAKRGVDPWMSYLGRVTLRNAFTNMVVTVSDGTYFNTTGTCRRYRADEISNGFVYIRDAPASEETGYVPVRKPRTAIGARVTPYGKKSSYTEITPQRAHAMLARGLESEKHGTAHRQALELDQLCSQTLAMLHSGIDDALDRIETDKGQYCSDIPLHEHLQHVSTEFHRRVFAHSQSSTFTAFVQFLSETQAATEEDRKGAMETISRINAADIAKFRKWNAAECQRQWLVHVQQVMTKAEVQFECLANLAAAVRSGAAGGTMSLSDWETMKRTLSKSHDDLRIHAQTLVQTKESTDMTQWRETVANAALVADCATYNMRSLGEVQRALRPFQNKPNHGAWRNEVQMVIRVPEGGIGTPPSKTIDRIRALEQAACTQSLNDSDNERERYLTTLEVFGAAIKSLLSGRKTATKVMSATTIADVSRAKDEMRAFVTKHARKNRMLPDAHNAFVECAKSLVASTRHSRLSEARIYIRDPQALNYLRSVVLTQPMPQPFAWYLKALENMARVEHVLLMQNKFALNN